uniref:Putative transposase n=1 Tax=termite gut metagenome TaxID=433724 RepID=S0DG07_9ZZZZ
MSLHNSDKWTGVCTDVRPFVLLIIMTICAVVSGCEHWEDIADFCRVKEPWFKEKLGLELKNGVASHDTFQRIFAIIKPKELEGRFIAWMKAVAKNTKGECVNIDGKTIRGSRDESDHVIHMVSAWANKNQMVLGQVRTDGKSNEITAIPELLALLELKGCIVTIDAMGCQKDIARRIVDAGAGYVLALKENHPTLYDDVQVYFETALAEKSLYKDVAADITLEKGHGRIEKRSYYLTSEIGWMPDLPQWKGLRAIGMVHSRVEKSDGIHEQTRFFITTLTDIKAFANAVRSHWGIENSLHWCLDVAFNEDKSRTHVDNSGENFAVIRHIALNLLKAFPAKMSFARKRRKCEYDADFVADVLFAQFVS